VWPHGIRFSRDYELFLVRWKGHPKEDATWEPRANLSHCNAMLKKFEESIPWMQQEDEFYWLKGVTQVWSGSGQRSQGTGLDSQRIQANNEGGGRKFLQELHCAEGR